MHRHPASSGLGSNTCIQDALNLAWKLAYVIKGYAEPSLLESYSAERVPVGEQVVARANQSRKDYAPLNKCFRTTGAADPVAAGLARCSSAPPATWRGASPPPFWDDDDAFAQLQTAVTALDLDQPGVVERRMPR